MHNYRCWGYLSFSTNTSRLSLGDVPLFRESYNCGIPPFVSPLVKFNHISRLRPLFFSVFEIGEVDRLGSFQVPTKSSHATPPAVSRRTSASLAASSLAGRRCGAWARPWTVASRSYARRAIRQVGLGLGRLGRSVPRVLAKYFNVFVCACFFEVIVFVVLWGLHCL